MIRSILVAGGGSAGLLAALFLKRCLPNVAMTVVRSKEIGVIGVGESTTVAMPRMLHGLLEIDPHEFFQKVQPSWKLGIRFLWGPRPFFDYTFDLLYDWRWDQFRRPNGYYCDDDVSYVNCLSALMSHNKVFERQRNGLPYIHRCFGYHLENSRFVAYLEEVAARRGIPIHEGRIAGATHDASGVTGVRLESGETLSAAFYVDCTGFRSLLLGNALGEPYTSFKSTLFCDRALVAAWPRTDEPIQPYTTAETMEAGWCWRIDHPDYINRGYVYSSDFISDEEAEREYRAKNPRVRDARIIPFTTGRYARGWVKNVVAIGNSVGFVEPLESTALADICDEARIVGETLHDCNLQPSECMVRQFNILNARVWDQIRDFLGIHYKFNTRLDNRFWRACRADTQLGPVQELVDFFQSEGPSCFHRHNLIHGNDMFGLEGYLALLVGQKVPYRARHEADAEERRLWNELQTQNRQRADAAMTVPDALQVVASPAITWVPGFFNTPADAGMTNYIGTAG